MARRPRDAEATRLQILDAAEALFAEHGFGSTSLAAIARQSDTHKSLILHHFGSKEDLWQAVKERRFDSFTREQKDMFQRGRVTLDEIVQTTRAYFRLLQGDPVLVQLLTRAELEKDIGCSQYDEVRLSAFVERLRQAQQAGILRPDIPPAHLLLIIVNVITQWFEARAIFSTWSELESERLDDDFLDSFIKLFFQGARVPGQAGAAP
ncbi:MAG: TetR/AcrR family transcriptional regulator [Xanthomonadales bacterium]|nr:TetR/AcrR family transcriptional regulator [Xanthomonadales bacterium]